MTDVTTSEAVVQLYFCDENENPTVTTAGYNVEGFVNGVRITGAGELTIRNDTTYVQAGPSATEHDPKWSHIDKRGHFHAYTGKGETPTLVWKHSEPYYCDSCNDEHTDDWQECLICGEHVNPGRKSVPWNTRYDVGSELSMSVKFSISDPGREKLDRLGQTNKSTDPLGLVSLSISGDGLDLFGFVRPGEMELSFKGKGAPRADATASGRLYSRLKDDAIYTKEV